VYQVLESVGICRTATDIIYTLLELGNCLGQGKT